MPTNGHANLFYSACLYVLFFFVACLLVCFFLLLLAPMLWLFWKQKTSKAYPKYERNASGRASKHVFAACSFVCLPLLLHVRMYFVFVWWLASVFFVGRLLVCVICCLLVTWVLLLLLHARLYSFLCSFCCLLVCFFCCLLVNVVCFCCCMPVCVSVFCCLLVWFVYVLFVCAWGCF